MVTGNELNDTTIRLVYAKKLGDPGTTVPGIHQNPAYRGLAAWQLEGYSVHDGYEATISGSWIYWHTQIKIDTLDANAEWALIWCAHWADNLDVYVVGLYQSSVAPFNRLRLWRVNGGQGSPTFNFIADGTTNLNVGPLAGIHRLEIALCLDSGSGDYRRIKVYLDGNLEINELDASIDTVRTTFGFWQYEKTEGKNATPVKMIYDHVTWNDDGGSDAALKGLRGADWAVVGHQAYADATPNEWITTETKKYKAIDDPNESSAGSSSMTGGFGLTQAIAPIDVNVAASGKVHAVLLACQSPGASLYGRACVNNGSESWTWFTGSKVFKWLEQAPGAQPWDNTLFDSLNVHWTGTGSIDRFIAEVAGYKIITADPNNNGAGDHADETGKCPEGRVKLAEVV